MDIKILVLLFGVFVTVTALDHDYSGLEWEPVGCFYDSTKGRREKEKRALRFPYKTYRGSIDWTTNLGYIIKGCGDEALSKGFDYFAVQFWGECWSDKDANERYDDYGNAPIGTRHDLKTQRRCDDRGIGVDFTNYVYRKVNCSSVHGCCPDGVTPSPGPNGQGCIGYTCSNPEVDLGFVIDSSSSLGGGDYTTQQGFLNDVIDELSTSSLTLHIGLIRFAAQRDVLFDFDDHSTLAAIKTAISGTSHINQDGTYIGNALQLANTSLFQAAAGMSETSSKVLVLITDGADNSGSPGLIITASDSLKARNIRIITVGVGSGIKESELKAAASDEGSFYGVTDFAALAEEVENVANNACRA